MNLPEDLTGLDPADGVPDPPPHVLGVVVRAGRTRRRRRRMLAVTPVVCAAVAAVAIAASSAGGGRNGGVSRLEVASPTISATPPPTQATRPSPTATATATGGGTGLGLQVSSVTFVSADEGWVIGTYEGRTGVERTTDGGAHWTLLAASPPGLEAAPQGIQPPLIGGIRFADGLHGYAFSTSALDVTDDGGRTWKQVAIPNEDRDGSGATDVEAAGGRVWLLNAAIPYPSIYTAPVGSTRFTRIGRAGNRLAFLATRGPEAYVVGTQGAGPVLPNLEVATTSGVSPRTSPCAGGPGANRPGSPGDITGLVTTPLAGVLDAMCSTGPYVPMPSNTVELSADDGESWTVLQTTSNCSAVSFATTSSRAFLACADGGIEALPGRGSGDVQLASVKITYVGFTNDQDGVALSDPTGKGGALYLTRDGGTHWTKAAT